MLMWWKSWTYLTTRVVNAIWSEESKARLPWSYTTARAVDAKLCSGDSKVMGLHDSQSCQCQFWALLRVCWHKVATPNAGSKLACDNSLRRVQVRKSLPSTEQPPPTVSTQVCTAGISNSHCGLRSSVQTQDLDSASSKCQRCQGCSPAESRERAHPGSCLVWQMLEPVAYSRRKSMRFG